MISILVMSIPFLILLIVAGTWITIGIGIFGLILAVMINDVRKSALQH